SAADRLGPARPGRPGGWLWGAGRRGRKRRARRRASPRAAGGSDCGGPRGGRTGREGRARGAPADVHAAGRLRVSDDLPMRALSGDPLAPAPSEQLTLLAPSDGTPVQAQDAEPAAERLKLVPEQVKPTAE